MTARDPLFLATGHGRRDLDIVADGQTPVRGWTANTSSNRIGPPTSGRPARPGPPAAPGSPGRRPSWGSGRPRARTGSSSAPWPAGCASAGAGCPTSPAGPPGFRLAFSWGCPTVPRPGQSRPHVRRSCPARARCLRVRPRPVRVPLQPPGFPRRARGGCGGPVRGRGRRPFGRGNGRDAPTASAPEPVPPPVGNPVTTPPVHGLHLQFGADASSEIVVSWHTLQPVRNPRVLLGALDGRLRADRRRADRASYTDAKSGQIVYAHHARSRGLHAGHGLSLCRRARRRRAGVRLVPHRAARPRSRSPSPASATRARPPSASVRPAGRRHARQPALRQRQPRLAGRRRHHAGVERVQPLFHLFNGDLCYANLAERPGAHLVRTSGTTTAAAPATGRGCRRPATTRTSSATARSATRPTRPTSRAARQPARPT